MKGLELRAKDGCVNCCRVVDILDGFEEQMDWMYSRVPLLMSKVEGEATGITGVGMKLEEGQK